ncbi:unnamed protein product [Amoebophrya sp. A25]|nr:unnamed protein product [Amoebophrya sp. A25]|eukprot:GSA25T00017213001.1
MGGKEDYDDFGYESSEAGNSSDSERDHARHAFKGDDSDGDDSDDDNVYQGRGGRKHENGEDDEDLMYASLRTLKAPRGSSKDQHGRPDLQHGTTKRKKKKKNDRDDVETLLRLGAENAKRKREEAAFEDDRRDVSWDPIAEERAKKKQKVFEQLKKKEQTSGVTGSHGLAKVQLHGLLKAPSLNGRLGWVSRCLFDAAVGEDSTTKEERLSVTLLAGTGTGGISSTGNANANANEVKSLLPKNLVEVRTGSLGRISGLEGARELNGQLCQYGAFHVEAGRYDVVLADGAIKRIKNTNIELVRNYDHLVLPKLKVLEEQQSSATKKGGSSSSTTSSSSASYVIAPKEAQALDGLRAIENNGLPVPQLVKLEDLLKAVAAVPAGGSSSSATGSDSCSHLSWLEKLPTVSGRALLNNSTDSSTSAMTSTSPDQNNTSSSSTTQRVVFISLPRHALCTSGGVSSAAEANKLRLALQKLALEYKRLFNTTIEKNSAPADDGQDVYFLFPHLAVKSFPILQTLFLQYYPCYLRLCREIVFVDHTSSSAAGADTSSTSPSSSLHHAWTRIDALLASQFLVGVPLYHCVADKHDKISLGGGESLLSTKKNDVVVPKPEDGNLVRQPPEQKRAVVDYSKVYGWKDSLKVEVWELCQ